MKRAALMAALWMAIAQQAVAAPAITVYTTSFLPVAHSDAANVTLYFLDEPEQPLSALSEDLPANYDAATPLVLARMNSPRGKQLLGDLKRAYQGVVNAWMNDVAHLPAILIDDRYVLYGIYDVNEALAILDNYQARHRQ